MNYANKRPLRCVAAALAAMLLLASCGASSATTAASSSEAASSEAAASSAASEAVEAPAQEEAALKYTQTVMDVKKGYETGEDYAEFVSLSEQTFLIPGLAEGLIPQGMDVCNETGIAYVSAYQLTSGKPSVIVAVDITTGESVAEYELRMPNGEAFTGHVGGVAVTETHLYVSGQNNSNGNSTIIAFPLSELPAEGSHQLVVSKTIPVTIWPSFLSYTNGMLWLGNFYYPVQDYPLKPEMPYTTTSADGEEYGTYIMGYDVSGGDETRMVVADGDSFVQPDVVLVAPDKIQGAVVGADGYVTLSCGYSRKENSNLLRYRLELTEESDLEVLVQDRLVPAYMLDSKRQTANVVTMSMSEGVADAADGGVYVLYESGAVRFANAKCRSDHVWKINFND